MAYKTPLNSVLHNPLASSLSILMDRALFNNKTLPLVSAPLEIRDIIIATTETTIIEAVEGVVLISKIVEVPAVVVLVVAINT